jgi:hypothetical protein
VSLHFANGLSTAPRCAVDGGSSGCDFFTYAECGLLYIIDNHVYVKRAQLALLNRVRLIQGLHAIVLGK